EVNATEVELGGVREYVEQTIAPVAADKALTLSAEVHPDAPAAIVTDEQRLQQILRNLPSNAVKFTERGTVSLRVHPAPSGVRFLNDALRGADGVVAFSVVDTGVGVAEDKLRLIFEAFQQADGTTSRRYGGTGLGLSISREIARLLGGEIQAESTVDEGSTFTLYLPAVYTGHPQGDTDAHASGASREEPMVTSPGAVTYERSLLAANELGDDRDALDEGDRVLLVVEGDPGLGRTLLHGGRTAG